MNKKKLIILVLIVLLLVLTGCVNAPKDEAGNVILITDETTFNYMFNNEGFFEALFILPLAKAINYFISSTNSVFFGVVFVTLIVNLLVLVLTWKQNVSQQKMQEIQPEITKLQKKYEGKNDETSRMRMQQEMMAIYQQNGVNPLGSFAGIFTQLPIMIAMYNAVIRSEYVAKGVFAGLNLDKTPLKGFNEGNYGYAILFVGMVIIQFASIKLPSFLAELKAKKEAEKQHRKYRKEENPANSTIYIMSAIFSFMALTFPSAMAVYWAISSVMQIMKTLIIHYFIGRKRERA